jgi:hypothetical protein
MRRKGKENPMTAPGKIWAGGQAAYYTTYWRATPPIQPELSQEIEYTRSDLVAVDPGIRMVRLSQLVQWANCAGELGEFDVYHGIRAIIKGTK